MEIKDNLLADESLWQDAEPSQVCVIEAGYDKSAKIIGFRMLAATELDMGSHEDILAKLKTLPQKTAACVNIDMRCTRFIDSSGFAMLLVIHDWFDTPESSFTISNPSKESLRLIRQFNLHTIYDIE